MRERSRPKSSSKSVMGQAWLLPFKNPLRERLGAGFFSALPRSPGIYRMLGEEGRLLYVGKAINLRNRLRSYLNARPDQSPRKVLRLLQQVRAIEWELCEDEREALLKENELLRQFKPPFNRVNTRPESYGFLSIRFEGESRAVVEWTQEPDSHCRGAFKSRARIREDLSALEHLARGARLSGGVRSHDGPWTFELRSPTARRHFRRFWNGRSRAWLDLLPLPATGFEAHAARELLEVLDNFYEHGPRRLRELCRQSRAATRWLSGADLDDAVAVRRASP